MSRWSALLKELLKGTDFKTSAINAFEDFKDAANVSHEDCNGDFNLLDNKEIPNLFPICKQLSSRLQTIYPDNKTVINNATENDIYVPHPDFFFVDLQYYADKMAEVTGDTELKTIATNLKKQMDKTILKSINFYNSPYAKGIKPKFTLSVVAVNNATYNGEGGQPTLSRRLMNIATSTSRPSGVTGLTWWRKNQPRTTQQVRNQRGVIDIRRASINLILITTRGYQDFFV